MLLSTLKNEINCAYNIVCNFIEYKHDKISHNDFIKSSMETYSKQSINSDLHNNILVEETLKQLNPNIGLDDSGIKSIMNWEGIWDSVIENYEVTESESDIDHVYVSAQRYYAQRFMELAVLDVKKSSELTRG